MSYDLTSYAQDPWDVITLNERPWYDGILRPLYARRAVYSPLTSMKVDLAAMKSRTVTYNGILPPRPNIGVIGNRDMEASRLYTDSYQWAVSVQRYGNGMSLHKEDEMFNYWQENGDFGLIPLIEHGLGQAMVDHIDLLARNAFLENYYAFMGDGSASGFSGITTSMKMSTALLDAINLGIEDRHSIWDAYDPAAVAGSIVCLTTPGAIYDLQHETSGTNVGLGFVNATAYGDGIRLLNGEIGSYRGVRFVKNPLAQLWNAGAGVVQSPIKTAVVPGSGATNTTVNGVYTVGQPDAKHYIEVLDASSFSANDRVTVHKIRHDGSNPRGVLNGLDYTDPMAQTMEIDHVDTVSSPDRIYFKEPYMMVGFDGKGLETDLGGTVYGYVTKARNIHTALFLNTASTEGVVCGVAQPPQIYTPPAIDDFLSIYRITYDMWLKFQSWKPETFEVAFLAGSNRNVGQVYVR